MIDIHKLKKMTYIALIDSVASLFYFGYIVEGFRITLSVVVFPILLYIYKELNPIITSIYTGIISILARSLFMTLSGDTFMEALYSSYPETAFYIAYGIFYYFLYYKLKKPNPPSWLIAIILCDFLSNIAEVFFRIYIYGIYNSEYEIPALFIIAIIRGGLAFLIVLTINYYRLLIVKKEHEERYRKLLDFSLDLRSETYYMNMNIDYIEKIMTNAYELYERLDDNDKIEERELALKISKDVHEIKKNYMRVIDGIDGIMTDKIEEEIMTLRGIVDILKKNLVSYINKNNLNIEMNFDIEKDIQVINHYYIMSILRNLFMNSIESIGDSVGEINLIFRKKGDEYEFIIKDNGKGIKDKNIKYIFHPGFSTKFNSNSGDIKRGIGLTLVKDIVENIFNGKIVVESKRGVTIFRIIIPKEKLEEK
ncbi:ATP-binding protein [Clostridium sp. D2Q-14]|uniref:ATP-binding protein n=1 Tax=Anaeromonas gelatinilytica TaxID=2683194 RepID=UPI00193C4E94|nr:ATP-binding protein [Anaeromonas gelatinilytica]MBS4536392.1 ATP-binding protein [Anaeromonas gelatinilytica]